MKVKIEFDLNPNQYIPTPSLPDELRILVREMISGDADWPFESMNDVKITFEDSGLHPTQ